MTLIDSYSSFVRALREAGFSVGSPNDEGAFSLFRHTAPNIAWHAGDPDTDPWEWRLRVLRDCGDIAYSKVFFRKSGYITREWYPCFLAARRGGLSLEEAYEDGRISRTAKQIYELIEQNDVLPLHEIRLRGNFGKDDRGRFERAVVELQMGLYITVCGSAHKRNRLGEEYGWTVTSFCKTESFWGREVFDRAAALTPDEAAAAIRARLRELNPAYDEKRAARFICG